MGVLDTLERRPLSARWRSFLLPLCLLAQSTALEPISVVVDNARATLRVSRDADMRNRAAAFCIEQGIGNLKRCTRLIHNAAVDRVVSASASCSSRSLLIVAHPDDETIFAGHEVLQATASAHVCWTIICVTGGAERNKREQFEAAIRELKRRLAASPSSGATLERYEMWSYHDCTSCVPFRLFAPTTQLLEAHYVDTIEADLMREVGRQNFDGHDFFGKIVTHNAFGEYGHLQHRELHEQVLHAVKATRRNDTASLHVFQPFTIASGDVDPKDPRSVVLREYPRISTTLEFWSHVSSKVVQLHAFDRRAAAIWCQSQAVPESSGMTLLCT